jgi:hypothetical protein
MVTKIGHPVFYAEHRRPTLKGCWGGNRFWWNHIYPKGLALKVFPWESVFSEKSSKKRGKKNK